MLVGYDAASVRITCLRSSVKTLLRKSCTVEQPQAPCMSVSPWCSLTMSCRGATDSCCTTRHCGIDVSSRVCQENKSIVKKSILLCDSFIHTKAHVTVCMSLPNVSGPISHCPAPAVEALQVFSFEAWLRKPPDLPYSIRA